MTQLDTAVPRKELGSARWSLILGTAMAAILFGGLLIVTSPGFVEPVPEAISIRTDLSLGTFTATGDAVDSGRICAGGVFLDQPPDRPRQPPGGILATRFVCGDGGADFRIRGDVVKRNPLFKQDEGVWRVVKLRGMDTNLEGAGRFIARKDSLGHKTLTVTYTGEMTLPP